MRPDPQDRLTQDDRPKAWPGRLLIIGVVIALVLVLWFFNRGEPEPQAPAAQQPVPEEPVVQPDPALPPAPDIPEPPPAPEPPPVAEAAPEEPNMPAEPLEPPASLETSDAEIRQRMAEATSSPLLDKTLATDDLVERSTAAVDTLSRGALFTKLLPVVPPRGDFSVVEIGDQVTIDPASYARYEPHVKMIEGLDVEVMVDTFHRFRPLLEQTYADMGYRAEDFDNALIRALDRILAVPQIDGPIPVVKSEAIYKFADPALERRSALDKQLLRMGPDNLARVQQQVRILRDALLEGP